jgi:hypothetical protein
MTPSMTPQISGSTLISQSTLKEAEVHYDKPTEKVEERILSDRVANFSCGRTVESIRSRPKCLERQIQFNLGPTILSSNIMVGSREDAGNSELLNKWGVTHVLNVAKQVRFRVRVRVRDSELLKQWGVTHVLNVAKQVDLGLGFKSTLRATLMG